VADTATTPRGRVTPDWLILALACVAQFMVILDVSIVNVALPSIGRDLHYSPTGLQWVVNAYVLTFAGFLLLGGRAADLFGRRRIFILGLAIFTGASLVGGLAQNAAWLTAARAAQGVGGAFLSPATLTIVVTTFSGPRLAKALGAWSAVAGAGGAVGSLLGGVLTAELSWRWVLFVNIPIGVAAIVGALIFLTEIRRPSGQQALDVAGAVVVTLGLGTLIYAIVGTDTSPWGSIRTLATLGVAAVLLGLFALIELRWASHPLVPFGLFRSRWVTGANAVMALVGGAFFSMWYFLSLYLQNVLGYGALRAGLAFVPMALFIITGAQVSSRLLARLGARPLLMTGTLLATGGFFWLAQVEPHSSLWAHVLLPACTVSLALGLLFTPLAAAGTSDVAPTEAGLASGVLNTSRQVGGSVGLAVLATIAISYTHRVLAGGQHGPLDTLTAGYARAFWVAGFVSVAAFACSFIVPRPAPTSVAGAEPADRAGDDRGVLAPNALGGEVALVSPTSADFDREGG
jgi:EmrB/QacA subfamily drug resistance transporter